MKILPSGPFRQVNKELDKAIEEVIEILERAPQYSTGRNQYLLIQKTVANRILDELKKVYGK
jgi:hypothetical protein